MAGHYGTTVCPARPRKPRDKAKVEQSVLLVERWVLARMRNRRFFSLAELNAAVTALHNARVSTEDQRLDLQRARLTEAGCGRLFEEKISGAARQRPALEQLLRELRPDDLLVVTRLDRLARSTSELLRVAEAIREKGAGLQSLEEPWAVKSLGTVTPVSRRIPTPWKTGPSLSTWGHRRDPRPERSAFALREAEGVGGACAPTWVSSEADLSFVF